MKRSRMLGACAWCVAALVGCGEPSVPSTPPAPHPLAARHEEVTLATTTAPSHAVVGPTVMETVSPRPSPSRDEVSVRRLVVALGIEDHEPIGVRDVFDAEEERVYAFLELANPGGAQTLVVTFASDDGARVVGHVDVDLPAHAPRWRTWAFTRHLTPGAWHAEVRTQEGRLVDERAFDVE